MGFQKPVVSEEMDSEQALRDAVALAGSAQKVVLCLGEHRECTGEAASREVSFTISEPMLRFFDLSMNHVSEPGDFWIFIGPDSRTENMARLTLLDA